MHNESLLNQTTKWEEAPVRLEVLPLAELFLFYKDLK